MAQKFLKNTKVGNTPVHDGTYSKLLGSHERRLRETTSIFDHSPAKGELPEYL